MYIIECSKDEFFELKLQNARTNVDTHTCAHTKTEGKGKGEAKVYNKT